MQGERNFFLQKVVFILRFPFPLHFAFFLDFGDCNLLIIRGRVFAKTAFLSINRLS